MISRDNQQQAIITSAHVTAQPELSSGILDITLSLNICHKTLKDYHILANHFSTTVITNQDIVDPLLFKNITLDLTLFAICGAAILATE